jgi:hypothetical protein
MPSVPGFLPSKSCFHFDNRFPGVPDVTINVAGAVVEIGNAANGLCGGMVYAVRDFFEVNSAVPATMQAPTNGPLFDYIVARLFDSFNVGVFVGASPKPLDGPQTYLYLMQPTLPDHETWLSRVNLAPHGRAWVMINSEWPKIKSDIDSGHPSPLALVTVKSFDPFQLGNNHQVLAYGYDLDGSALTLHIYDPNSHDNDNVRLSLNLANPQQTTDVAYNQPLGGDKKIWCFFRSVYAPVVPPKTLMDVGTVPTVRAPPTIQSPLTGDGTDNVTVQVTRNAAASNRVGLRLTAANNITWWKAADIAGQEVWTKDQVKQASIEVALSDFMNTPVLILKKAKWFGIHTQVQVVVVQNPSSFGGCLIDLLWTKDA